MTVARTLDGPGDLRGRRRLGETVVRVVLMAAASASILTTIGIIYVLVSEAIGFFGSVSFLDFISGTRWAPDFGSRSAYGVLPLVWGTMYVALIGMLLAVPVGLAIAVYLSEYASVRVRKVLKPFLEILAGIPTVVLGFFALNFVTRVALRPVVPDLSIFNVLSSGIVVGIMIVPTIASLSDDAMRAVPQGLREAGFGLGGGPRRVSLRIVVPAALSGIAASIILAFSRAVGETMIVAIANGALPQITMDPREGMQTITAAMVQLSTGDSPAGSIAVRSLFALGATLFVVTFLLNWVSHRVVRRFREVYD